MFNRMIFLTLCAAFAAPLHAASTAATQAWVTNYVEKAIQDAGITPSELPTNVVSGTIDVSARTLTYTCEGETYTVGIALTNGVADTGAFEVCESTDASAVPTGTVFVLSESTGRYVNRSVAFPNDLTLTVTNGCCELSQTGSVWTASGNGWTNFTHVVVESNGVYQFSFSLYKTFVTAGEALAAGVTNATVTAWEPSGKSTFEYVLGLICGAAYADSSYSPSATAFDYVYTINLKDGTSRTGFLIFKYSGPKVDWNLNPDEGYPYGTASDYYEPNMWPHASDWYSEGSWSTESEIDGKYVITSYIKRGGEYVPIEVAVTKAKLLGLADTPISACIPAFRAPEYVHRETTEEKCARKNHYWRKCVCVYCKTERDHDLAEGDPGTCDRCENLDGWAESPGSDKCGSTCVVGTLKSGTGHHHGWHDGDGTMYNSRICTCECGDWKLYHTPSGEKTDVGQGYREKDGTVSEASKKTYHHYSVLCDRLTGVDDEICGAPVNYNEVHDFKSATGASPVPFVGDPSEPESVVYLAHGEQSASANDEKHYCGEMTCTLAGCGRTSSEYEAHDLDEACVCTGCGLALHEESPIDGTRDGGYWCDEAHTKKVPGCARCNTYSESGDPVHGRTSNLLDKFHFNENKGVSGYNATHHVCECGRVTSPHVMEEVSDKHWECKYCPYEYDGDTPPCGVGFDYVTDGWCGHWITRSGKEYTGGTLYLRDGTTAVFPTDHTMGAVSGRLCHRCTNISPLTGKACHRRDSDDMSRHGGWHHTSLSASNETTRTTGPCTCACGLFHRDHEAGGDVVSYVTGENGECLAVGTCVHIGPVAGDTACATPCSNVVSHAFVDLGLATYASETNHSVRFVCDHGESSGCGLVTNILFEHCFVSTNTPAPTYADADFHKLYLVCVEDENGYPGCGCLTNELERHNYVVTNIPPRMVDSTNHYIYVVCSSNEFGDAGCGNVTNKLEQHDMSTLDWERTTTNCRAYYWCKDKCGYETNVLALGAHQLASPYSYVTFSNCYHHTYAHCIRAVLGSVCGATCLLSDDRCESYPTGAAALTLVDDPEKKDYYPCRWCVKGHATEVPHNWQYNSEEHWCLQSAAAGEHLRAAHTYVDDVCTVCGCSRGSGLKEDYEYKYIHDPVVCKDSCCYEGSTKYERRYMTNGVVIAESERGDWVEVHWEGGGGSSGYTTCHYNVNGTCNCPYCRGDSGTLLYNGCYCPHVDSELIKFTDAIITGDYHLRYAGSKMRLVDFSDPVYEVGANCFREAFVSMPNLISVNASTITNVGGYAFQFAFTNCVSLQEVSFAGLAQAGTYSFEGAFKGDASLTSVDFGKLRKSGTGAFFNAFAGTGLTSLSMPCLEESNGNLNFFGGTVCATVKHLYLTNLRTASYVGVDLMPNLEKIDMSYASTNAITAVGNMRDLNNLKWLYYKHVAGVPRFRNSIGETCAPTNTACTIVVPDELLAEWRAAEGWSNTYWRIVCPSNMEVVPPPVIITVEFEPNNYGTMPSTNIVAGTGIYPEMNDSKYAFSAGGHDDGAFTFVGWYRDEALTIPYVSGSAIDESCTLYAKWNDHREISTMYTEYGAQGTMTNKNARVTIEMSALKVGYYIEDFAWHQFVCASYVSNGTTVTNRYEAEMTGVAHDVFAYIWDPAMPPSPLGEISEVDAWVEFEDPFDGETIRSNTFKLYYSWR